MTTDNSSSRFNFRNENYTASINDVMLLGIKWYHFISNDEVRHQTNQPVLTEIIQAWRLSLTLIGHIARMDDNIDAKHLDFRAFCVLEETTRMTAEDLDEDGAE